MSFCQQFVPILTSQVPGVAVCYSCGGGRHSPLACTIMFTVSSGQKIRMWSVYHLVQESSIHVADGVSLPTKYCYTDLDKAMSMVVNQIKNTWV